MDKEFICNICKSKWKKQDLQHAKWAGFPFKFSEKAKQLICPECYSDMHAAFIGSPDKFKELITENFTA